MSDIPTEVMFEILCGLPVKSLLKFRCVSKSWKALIDSPIFVEMHLKRSNTNPKIILFGDSCFCNVSFDLLETDTPIDVRSATTMVMFNNSIEDEDRPTFVLGHCNGLLLITCGLICALWNPSTLKFFMLPNFKCEKLTKGTNLVQFHNGFGYDKVTDDYKVLRIMQVIGEDASLSLAVVYSLKLGIYRRIKEFPFWIVQVGGGVFVFGALHWLVLLPSNMDDEYMIVAFDLGSEEYKWVPLPLHLHLGIFKLNRVCLGVFEGCLSLSCNYECKHVDIWLLRDPRNRDSWAKFFSLEVGIQVNVKPISYSKCGKYVILEKDEEQLLCYDLELKSMRKTAHSWTLIFFYFPFSGKPCAQ